MPSTNRYPYLQLRGREKEREEGMRMKIINLHHHHLLLPPTPPPLTPTPHSSLLPLSLTPTTTSLPVGVILTPVPGVIFWGPVYVPQRAVPVPTIFTPKDRPIKDIFFILPCLVEVRTYVLVLRFVLDMLMTDSVILIFLNLL